MKKVINFISKYKYVILLIILYIVFFLQMQLVYFYGDDFQVMYPIHNDRSFGNILIYCLKEMSFFWNEWSGRLVGHFIVSFGLSFFGIQFFRILNPIMVFIMIYLCLKIFSLFKNIDLKKCLFYFSLIVIGFNVHIARETLYWAYGGILYIWGFNLTLFVIYFVYKYYLLNKKIKKSLLILLSLICFLHMFILEQLSFILIVFLFFILIASWKKQNNIKEIILLLIISIIGFLISSLAPGNFLRAYHLIDEISLYTNLQSIFGKIQFFFNMLLNPNLFGIYFLIFDLIINYKYISKLNGHHKIFKLIPCIILISYIFIFLLYKIFDVNILFFHNNQDAMEIFSSYEFQKIPIINIILMYTYYFILVISVLYISCVSLWKDKKFLFLSLIVTFISTIIPVIFIRYMGIRYYLYFLLTMIIISFDCIHDMPKNALNLKFLYVFEVICSLILICNIISIFNGYLRNSKINLMNSKALIENNNKIIVIDEIPYEDFVYTWHSIYTDYRGNHSYYGFYLNEFYENFYSIDTNNIHIRTVDGLYVR